MKTRYALLTVDTEALPNRAETDHVDRLILGIHGDNEAGVRQMARIGAEFNASLIFFLDICGAFSHKEELSVIAKWLDDQGQDVQLHVHPEYLPAKFWQEHKLNPKPVYLNRYDDNRADFLITHFAKILQSFTGKAPVAFRAGSFRWNTGTLKALAKNNILFSFNNSMSAMRNGRCPFSLPVNDPYSWSNGVVEIPVSEQKIFWELYPLWWARLQFPQSPYFRMRSRAMRFLPFSVPRKMDFMVFLIHSWSFLFRDENGFEVYRNDREMENFRKFLKMLSRECEIINTVQLKELIDAGKIKLAHTENIDSARYMVPR